MMEISCPDGAGYGRMAELTEKYANIGADHADCSLIWLAEETGTDRILTIDTRDFGLYRIASRSRFDLIRWF